MSRFDLYQVECLRDVPTRPRGWFADRADAEAFAAQFGADALITCGPTPEAQFESLERTLRARIADLTADLNASDDACHAAENKLEELDEAVRNLRKQLAQSKAAQVTP